MQFEGLAYFHFSSAKCTAQLYNETPYMQMMPVWFSERPSIWKHIPEVVSAVNARRDWCSQPQAM